MKPEVNDTFLYDLNRLSDTTRKLCAALRDLRVVATSAKERWKCVYNYEPQMAVEIAKYKDQAEIALKEAKVSIYTLTGQSLEIDLTELVEQWLNNKNERR